MKTTYLVIVAIEGDIQDRPNYHETEIDLSKVIENAIENGEVRGIISQDRVILSPSKTGTSHDYERCSGMLHRG